MISPTVFWLVTIGFIVFFLALQLWYRRTGKPTETEEQGFARKRAKKRIRQIWHEDHPGVSIEETFLVEEPWHPLIVIVDLPTWRRMDRLLNHILDLAMPRIRLKWNPLGATTRLKNGAEWGTLIAFLDGGRRLRVLPDGYKRAQDFHPAYWEFVE
jgi:hypothetical protein